MGRFTELIPQIEATPTQGPVLDPFSDARMRNAVPDNAAAAQRLAAETGVDVRVAERNLEELRAREEAARFRAFVRETPEVQALGPDFFTTAKDDVTALGHVRLAGKNIVAAGFRALGSLFGVGLATQESFTQPLLGSDFVFAAIEKKLSGADDTRSIQDIAAEDPTLMEWQREMTTVADQLTAENENLGIVGQSVYSGIQSLAQNVPLIAAGYYTRQPEIALGGMSALVFGGEYGEAREAGKGVPQSLTYAGLQGSVEGAMEKIPLGALFGDLAADSGLMKTIMRQMLLEVPTEQATTILQDFNQFVTLHPEQTIEDYLAARPEAAVRTLISTMVATGAQTTIIHTLAGQAGAEVASANQGQKLLDELAGASEESLLRERAPEQFRRYVESITPDTDLYVDAEDMQQALEQSEFDLPEELEARIAEAFESNAPVKFTPAEYATYFSGQGTAQFLSAKVRVGRPNALNAEEAANIQGEFAARANEALAEADNRADISAQGAEINAQVLAQIQSTGRFRADTANAYASMIESFFVTMAGRTGQSPAELFAQFPLRVRASGQVEPEATLEQLPASAFAVDRAYGSEVGPDTFVISIPDAEAEGGELGRIEVVEQGDTMQIKHSLLSPSLRGQGIGQQLIEQAYLEAQRGGRRLVSDRAVSALQLRAYEALRRRGWIIRYTNPEDVQRVLDLADRAEARGRPISALGASVGIGEAVVRVIEPPPAAATLDPNNLRPVAALANEASELPEGFSRFRHFGNFIVPQLDPNFQGTGMRGEEAKRGGPKVTSLYPDTGFQRESGVGPNEYVVDVPSARLYDASADPEGFMALASEPTTLEVGDDGKLRPAADSEMRVDFAQFEQLVKDAGYAGYTTPGAEGNMRGQARIFEPVPVIGARQQEPLFQMAPEAAPEGWEAVLPYLSEEERAQVTKRTAQSLLDTFNALPAAEDYADAAQAGEAVRGWYDKATRAIRQVFGDTDAPRFAGLVAALSPQTDVQTNLENAVKVWVEWDKAGRPTEKDGILEAMNTAFAPKRPLPAWVKNTVTVLSAEDPTQTTLSGPKVNAFMRNLAGNVNAVTNDTWMARFALLDPKEIGGRGPGAATPPAYHALSARVRQAAELLTKRTGTTWTPAQVQETVWGFVKTAYELSSLVGNPNIEGLVKEGAITDEQVARSQSLGDMLLKNESIRTILEESGYADYLTALEDSGLVGRDSGITSTTPRLLAVARRLDEQRAQEAETLEQGARLTGLPASSPGGVPAIQQAAEQYMAASGIKPQFPAQTRYVIADPERGARIAREYENAEHEPENPDVQKAYAALIAETLAQYQVIKAMGLQIEFIPHGAANPYASGPREVLDDLRRGHLWVFPTDSGFGQEEAPGHPLLLPTAERIGDRQLLANDVFRIVHDVFGHGIEGVGFGPNGEENAFQAHVRMYSPLAARAMTTETRGQNSWVNFGPHGESNRANQKETRYAEQKATLLPEWVTTEGVELSAEEQARDLQAVADFVGASPFGAAAGMTRPGLRQGARGNITLGKDVGVPSTVTLFENADLSTFLHESGHFFLEILADMAARPNAPAAIREDMETLLKWFKYEGTPEQWRALSIPERREHHERFARGFETWLMEGDAPTEALRPLFHRFRAWLVNLYGYLHDALRVQLTPEVRDVMSRLIADSQAIKAAEASRSYAPLFADFGKSGMTPEEWVRYQETTALATQQAEDQLQARSLRNLRWLDNARSRELKKLQNANADKRAAVEAEVNAELDKQPVRMAENILLTGRAYLPGLVDDEPQEVVIEGNHKLSTDALAESYGTREEHKAMAETAGLDPATVKAPWQSLPRQYTAKEGLTADEVAEIVGMQSGDQLVSELLALEPREQAVQRETDKRMLQRYGDLNNPQMLSRAVDNAVHNQFRMRAITAELGALDNALKAQPGGIEATRRAAREFAASVIQRRKIRDLRPGQFSVAETKAAKESRAALTAGDLKLAATRKRDQLFNGYASRNASRAIDYVEKNLRYLQTFNDAATRGRLDPNYRDQIDKLLERFDLRRRSLREIDKRTSLVAWVEEQRANGTEPIVPDELLDESRRTNYQNMTYEQFQGLVDTVKNMQHLSQLKKRLLASKEKRDFDDAVNQIVTGIEDNSTGARKDELEKATSMWGRIAATTHEWLTHLRKFSSIARQIDGGKDGGPFWSFFIRAMNDAGNTEQTMRADATRRMTAIINTVPALRSSFGRRLAARVAGAPKLFIPEINRSLSLEARLAVALNWGNEGNRERIMEGNKWTQAQAQAVIDTLTKEEMDFVQATWDLIGSYWPQIAAKEERINGVRPTRVDPTPVVTRHGQYAGGYYPIVADSMRSERAAQQNDAELIGQALRGSVTRATTRRGHTKARVGGSDPVRLDLGVIAQHLSQVIHDLAWHETLIDTGRLLRDKRVSESLRTNYGPEVTKLMRRTLDDVARGEVVAKDAGERLVNHFRVGATIAALGFNLTTGMLQLTGLTQSMVRVGYLNMGRGLVEFAARPLASFRRVHEASEFMRERHRLLNREMAEITDKFGQKQGMGSRAYFLPIQVLQQAVDIPTWLAGYAKAIDAGEDHDRAVSLADQGVRDAQTTGALHDLAEVQRGGAYKKLLTNFYSYFSATYQLSAESVQNVKREKSAASVVKAASDFIMLFTVPALLGMLIREGLRGDLDDKEPEELAAALLKEQLAYMLGVFPYVREAGGAFAGFEYRGPAGLSFLSHVTTLIKQIEQGEVDEALLRAANRALGVAFHYPAGQIDKTVRGMIAVAEGEAGPGAVVVGPPSQE